MQAEHPLDGSCDAELVVADPSLVEGPNQKAAVLDSLNVRKLEVLVRSLQCSGNLQIKMQYDSCVDFGGVFSWIKYYKTVFSIFLMLLQRNSTF